MTLPDADVYDLLANDFVVGWANIERENYVGLSHGYSPSQTAVGTTNCAGGRNVQLLVLSPDGVVLHALPGFWSPEDLVTELRFALQISRLWADPARTRAQKETMFRCLHRAQLARQDAETIARSDWQDFDRWAELERCKSKVRDTVVTTPAGYPVKDGNMMRLKPLNVVARERMMAQPFRKLAEFDFETFVDYGRTLYDNNEGIDKGKPFEKAVQREMQREKEAEKARKAAEKTPRN